MSMSITIQNIPVHVKTSTENPSQQLKAPEWNSQTCYVVYLMADDAERYVSANFIIYYIFSVWVSYRANY